MTSEEILKEYTIKQTVKECKILNIDKRHKKQATRGTTYLINKRLISRIYEIFLQINKKLLNPIERQAMGMNRQLTTEVTWSKGT